MSMIAPLSDPTKKIKIGHDDSDNGQLTGNEIDMIVGECSGDSGVVASIGSTEGSPEMLGFSISRNGRSIIFHGR